MCRERWTALSARQFCTPKTLCGYTKRCRAHKSKKSGCRLPLFARSAKKSPLPRLRILTAKPLPCIAAWTKRRTPPFGGASKLLWKVEWPAKWKVNGVMVEGAGKDHSTKGGSRDVGNHISKEVFNYEPPFDVPYEFFLVGGKKMSSSKGRGSSAKEIAALVPAKIFRLALLGKEINQQVNFDPEGDTIPVLYDQYDKLALGYQIVKYDDYARLFELIHPKTSRTVLDVSMSMPRFSQV